MSNKFSLSGKSYLLYGGLQDIKLYNKLIYYILWRE